MTRTMARPLSLSDTECLETSVAGGKAARLARARAAGLPALPGLVVPAAESVAALRDAETRRVRGGAHAARLAVMDADTRRLAGLPGAAAALSPILVVRSSSPLEGTSRWSGAFTSFLDVLPDDVLTAVRGVWASAAGEDACSRYACERSGREAGAGASPGLAVLIQPQVEPEFSGTAEVDGTGAVTIVTVAGPPAPLLAGWEPGHLARCAVDGTVSGDAAVALAGGPLLRDVAGLARAVRRELGDDLVEWAAVAGELVLLQCKVRAAPNTSLSLPRPEAELPAGAAEIARRVLSHAGPTGEQLVLPWLLAGEPSADPRGGPEGQGGGNNTGGGPEGQGGGNDTVAAWEEAERLATELIGVVWSDVDEPAGAAAGTLAALRGDAAGEALDRLRTLPAVDAAPAARVLALFDRVGRDLVERRQLTRPEQLWALLPDDVRRLLTEPDVCRDTAYAQHRAALRWEPFAYTAAMSEGQRLRGVPAAPGTGAGPVVFVAGRPDRTPPAPRAVIVAPRPLPHLAPLLWGASALVTFGGSTAAHLVEVARSLAVPAVVGCPAENLIGRAGQAMAAVDGDRGTVAVCLRPT